MNNYLYRYLPSGNSGDFETLDAELKKRGVKFATCQISHGKMWRIPIDQLSKLPVDEKGPYLGDDKTGYSLSNSPVWEDLRRDFGNPEWEESK